MKNIVPHGEMVLLDFVEVVEKDAFKANKAGILTKVPTDGKKKYQAVISKVGNGVDMSKVTWKIGDIVIYNEYDCLKFGDDDHTYGLTKAAGIWASYNE